MPPENFDERARSAGIWQFPHTWPACGNISFAQGQKKHYQAPDARRTVEQRRMAPLPVLDDTLGPEEQARMAENAQEAANFLKAISHEGRLMILCHLVTGEKSVTELERLLSARQAAVSQQLSRLRVEGLVVPRREGKTIYYSLADDRPRKVLEVVYDLFCGTGADDRDDAG